MILSIFTVKFNISEMPLRGTISGARCRIQVDLKTLFVDVIEVWIIHVFAFMLLSSLVILCKILPRLKWLSITSWFMNRLEGMHKTASKRSAIQDWFFHDCLYHPLIKFCDVFQINDGFLAGANIACCKSLLRR